MEGFPIAGHALGSRHRAGFNLEHAAALSGLAIREPTDLENRRIGAVVDGCELEHFEFALAVGGDHGGDVADFLADEAAADGRRGGDETLGDVGFFTGDELVGDVFTLGLVMHLYGGAEANLVAWDVFEVDHGELAHALFELAEAGVDELLALLGHVVFGVFGEVTERYGFFDLRGEFGGELVLEGADLFVERFFDVLHGVGSLPVRLVAGRG